MSFDLSASLRRLKPEKATGLLRRREDDALPFVGEQTIAGPPLMIDTTVYIDALQGRLPDRVARLMRARQINHSAVAVAELAHNFGRLDPEHAGTAKTLDAIRRTIDAISAHRLDPPSSRAIVEAGILAGTIARARKLPKGRKPPLFNDAILFLQAQEQGCCLLSRNVADFDAILQIVPAGRVLLYRQEP